MKVVGYSDPLSVAPRARIRFMVSCEEPTFDATVVRLVHGDIRGPGFRALPVGASINGTHSGSVQSLDLGSYVRVPDAPPLSELRSFSVVLWAYPTAPGERIQVLCSKWSPVHGGFSLELDEAGSLCLRVSAGAEKQTVVALDTPLHPSTWYRVAAAYDANAELVRLAQEPLREWPQETRVIREQQIECAPTLANDAPLLFAGRESEVGRAPFASFEGKIGGPAFYGCALAGDALLCDKPAETPIARWHLGLDVGTDRVVDRGAHGLDGVAHNMPMRGVTGALWTGHEWHFKDSPDAYDAIHFHSDDLVDAGWEPSLEWDVPADLPSGIYALWLRAGGSEDHVPFYIRPSSGEPRARLAYLVPTFSHLAYANERMMWDPARQEKFDMNLDAALARATPYERDHYRYAPTHNLLSLYDRHADGSGVCYASRLRPQINMRPQYNWPTTSFQAPHQFNQDLYLADWLEQKGFAYDVITDEDLHHEGEELVRPYRVVLTGSHPEYWTERMLTAIEAYLRSGGRVMYLGGNGFYWVTSVDAARPYVIEVRRGPTGTRTWEASPGEYHHATTGELGGLWRHRNHPPHRLVGVGFAGQGIDRSSPYRRLSASYSGPGAFVFDGVGDDVIGESGLHLGGAAGYEIDRADRALGTPAHTLRLAESFGHSNAYQRGVEDVFEMDTKQGGDQSPLVRSDIVLLEYPHGGAVFSVGSISWTGSLSSDAYNSSVSRVTENVLRRFLAPEPPIRAEGRHAATPARPTTRGGRKGDN